MPKDPHLVLITHFTIKSINLGLHCIYFCVLHISVHKVLCLKGPIWAGFPCCVEEQYNRLSALICSLIIILRFLHRFVYSELKKSWQELWIGKMLFTISILSFVSNL